MKNNDQLKEFINEIGFDRTLQCLIEALDDSIHNENIIVSVTITEIKTLNVQYM